MHRSTFRHVTTCRLPRQTLTKRLPSATPRRQTQRTHATQKPQWLRDLERDAKEDPAAAIVLEGAGGDPERVLENIRSEQAKKLEEIVQPKTGRHEHVRIRFREVNPFDLWIWMEFYASPSVSERELLIEVLRSWFVVGKLGGCNSANLQVSFGFGDTFDYFRYNRERSEDASEALLHEMEPLEFNDKWGRFRVDMGTADELVIDVLINMMITISREHVGIKQLIIGGQNASWPVPPKPQSDIQRDLERHRVANEPQRDDQQSNDDRWDIADFESLIGDEIDLNASDFH